MADGTDTSQAGGTEPNPQAGAGEQDDQQQNQTFDSAYVQKLRSEAASWRTQAQQHKKRLEDIERGQMSELDKLTKERDDIKAERDDLFEKTRISRVERVAAKAGAVYPDVVALKVPSDLDIDDEKAVAAAIQQVRKDYPAMFKSNGSADAGAGTNGKPLAGDFSDMIRQAAGRG